MGILDWFNQKISAAKEQLSPTNIKQKISTQIPVIKTVLYTSYSYLKTFGKFAYELTYAFLTTDAMKTFLYRTAIQSWEGATRFLDFYNITKLFPAAKTRSTLFQLFKTNVIFYLLPAIGLSKIQNWIKQHTPDSQDSVLGEINNIVATLIMLQLTGIRFRRIYQNLLLNLVLASQTVEENPISKHFKENGNKGTEAAKADVVGVVYYGAKMTVINILSYLPVLNYVTPAFRIYVLGESIAEYPYSAAGLNMEDRIAQLLKYIAYLWMIGLSYEKTVEWAAFGIEYFTGESSFFIADAVYATLYPWFICTVMLRDRPLPDSYDKGLDIFYDLRMWTQVKLSSLSKNMIALLDNQKKSIDWRKWFQQFMAFPPVQYILAKSFFYDPYDMWYGTNWHTWNGFITDPANMRFWEEKYPPIKEQLNNLKLIREKPEELALTSLQWVILKTAKAIPTMPDRVTEFFISREFKKLIKLVFDKKLKNPLEEVIEFSSGIDHLIKMKRAQEQTKIKKYHDDPKEKMEANLIEGSYKKPDKEQTIAAPTNTVQTIAAPTNTVQTIATPTNTAQTIATPTNTAQTIKQDPIVAPILLPAPNQPQKQDTQKETTALKPSVTITVSGPIAVKVSEMSLFAPTNGPENDAKGKGPETKKEGKVSNLGDFVNEEYVREADIMNNWFNI